MERSGVNWIVEADIKGFFDNVKHDWIMKFLHNCSTTRTGRRFRMKRATSRKKFRVKLAAYKQWLKTNRTHMNNRELWEKTCAKLRGHYAYYGVTDNFRGIKRFGYEVKRILFKWLNRHGGRRRMNWEKFSLMEK